MNECLHRQAEPVELTTGEIVACVCIECLQPLPADHIARQIRDAWDEARRERLRKTCPHTESVEIITFGMAEAEHMCLWCGTIMEAER